MKVAVQLTNIAKHTFYEFKKVYEVLRNQNLFISDEQLTDNLGHTIDAVVSQICHLMNWDYEISFDVVFEYLLGFGLSFDDLVKKIDSDQELIDKLRYEGVGE